MVLYEAYAESYPNCSSKRVTNPSKTAISAWVEETSK